MNIFDHYTHELLKEILKNKVNFLVVGGYAVNYHGYRRTTGDIDIWIRPDNTVNKERILKSLKTLKVESDKLKALEELDFSKPLVFIDGTAPFKIDFMTFISGVRFDDAWDKKIEVEIEGLTIPFIGFNDLIISKISSGRPQDKIDVETLQKIQKLRKTDNLKN